ncbi:M23 family metallopeptidase [Aquimarina longa]|uniref:M23 family metallopeptidase n=1 Tax=Aquimarina longa TaxID=1080221 RepID=UPI0007834762|nr:M23 family metallopeptidase [Aquimarina longa]
MFLINKRYVLYFLIAIPFFIISAQNTIVDHKDLFIEGETISLPIYLNNDFPIEENIFLAEELEEYNIKWDNQNFNPYWNEALTFPFQIKFRDNDFSSPVTHKMVITSRYGWRRRRPHRGIDIDLETGDSVKTILSGKIRYVGYHRGYGNTIVVRHYNGLETVYAHLSKLLVKENDTVKKGDVIGRGGVTGNARGSHLHLEVRYHGKSINPEYLFDFDTDRKIRSDSLFVIKKWATPRYHKSTRKSKMTVYKTIDDIAKIKEEEKKIYTVRKGDTLHRIANKYGLAISEICKINAIRSNSVLKIGQQIIID